MAASVLGGALALNWVPASSRLLRITGCHLCWCTRHLGTDPSGPTKQLPVDPGSRYWSWSATPKPAWIGILGRQHDWTRRLVCCHVAMMYQYVSLCMNTIKPLAGANYQFDHLVFLEPLQLPADAADPKRAYGGYMHILVPRSVDYEFPPSLKSLLGDVPPVKSEESR